MVWFCRYGYESGPPTAQMFGNAGREHMQRYGSRPEHFAKIAQKNHSHSKNNPKSQFKDQYSLDQINSATCIHDPLTKLHCCPTSDGAAAVIVGWFTYFWSAPFPLRKRARLLQWVGFFQFFLNGSLFFVHLFNFLAKIFLVRI